MQAARHIGVDRGVVLSVAAVLCLFVYVHLRAYIVYAGVENSMTRQQLIRHIGEPDRSERELIFCDPYFPWSGDCPENNEIVEFLYFKVGIDRWIIIGFNDADVIRFKTLGDT